MVKPINKSKNGNPPINYNEELMKKTLEVYNASFIAAYKINEDKSLIKLDNLLNLNRDSILEFTCVCGKVGKKEFRASYQKYCLCETCSKRTHMENIKKTLKERHGVENANDIPGVQEKINNTIKERHGENKRNEIIANMLKVKFEGLREKWERIKKEGKMICEYCNTEHPLNKFRKGRVAKEGYESWSSQCDNCRNENRTTNRNNKILNSSLKEFFEMIIKDAKYRNNAFNKKNEDIKREFNISSEYLVNIWEKQKGKCYYSGRDLQYNKIKEELPEDKRIHPERVSIDRIDSKKGYIEGNIVLCCWTANNIKQDLSMEEFKKWINDINNIIN